MDRSEIEKHKPLITPERVLIVVAGAYLLTFIGCNILWTVLFAEAEANNHPRRYIKQLKTGMTYEEIIDMVPAKFISHDIHSADQSSISYARIADKKNIDPEYLMVLSDTLWPITQATACYLFFDEDKCLIYHFTSSS
ncbi:hypothetical protein K8T06_01275 [bacterium]|nr:hypothetical protein [bacterium]